MIATGQHLARRTFLKGVGAAVALPMLDSMIPAFAAPAAAKSPVRLAFVYLPNGIVMKNWTPGATGAGFEFTPTLEPLAPFRDRMLVISGLADHNGNDLGDAGGDHARASASYLTGVHPKKTAGADIRGGISADQVAAQAIGSATRFPSLEFGLDYARLVGACDSGYSCAYMNAISWRGPASPLPPETNPRMLFERLFGAGDASAEPRTQARRARYRKSILDLVGEDTQKLKGKLGASDRQKIDEYLEAVRDVERRIEGAEKGNAAGAPAMEKPTGIPVDFAEYAKLMFDLQAMAFQTDLTRISTFMMAREQSNRSYGEIGIPEPHHSLSHHRGNAEWIEKLARIDRFHAELFSYLLAKLKSTRDGDGTLLDHSMIVYGGGLSDSNRHSHEDLPLVLAGGGGGWKPGRHIACSQNTPMTNLYLTLLDRAGVRAETIGDSSGKLDGLGGL